MFSLERHERNPILSPDPAIVWEREGVFNPGIARIGTEITMLYRAVGERDAYISHFGLATSIDGIAFTRAAMEPVFGPTELFDRWATEDPRITKIGDAFFVTYVAVADRIMDHGHGSFAPIEASTALLRTTDFRSFENLGIISPLGSDNKDIVLFPKKIAGRYCMLHRPNHWNKKWCSRSYTPGMPIEWPCELDDLPVKPGIWIAYSDDLIHWTDHRMILHASHDDDAKIGPGLPPIETEQGWLLIYHHVTAGAQEGQLTYTIRAALLDHDDPSTIIGKLPYDILTPQAPYEIENGTRITFPTGGFVDGDTLFIYYGASDRYVCLATGSISELLAELLKKY